MTLLSPTCRGMVAGVLAIALATPVPAMGVGASLGTARGVRAAQVSLGGGRWLPAGGRSLPVLPGAGIRSHGGGVQLDLADGSRVSVLPFSVVRVGESGGGPEIALESGRLTFRLPADARVTISTPSARLEPAGRGAVAGEVFAGDTTGLKMTHGEMRVRPLAGGAPVMLASLEPVFVPRRPAVSGPLFVTDAAAAAPAGSTGIFDSRGESLGYLRPDGRLVVHPGFAADLTGPFAPKTVRLALAAIPEASRSDAVPLFDVNGRYLGYVDGHAFHAQAQAQGPAPAPGRSGALGGGLFENRTTLLVVAGAAVVGLGIAGIAALNDDDEPATPVNP